MVSSESFKVDKGRYRSCVQWLRCVKFCVDNSAMWSCELVRIGAIFGMNGAARARKEGVGLDVRSHRHSVFKCVASILCGQLGDVVL